MKALFSIFAICLSLLGSGAAMAATGQNSMPSTTMNHGSMNQGTMDHGSMNQATANYSDRAFLSGMIAHHEGAIDMVKVLAKAPKTDPQVKVWADGILKAQNTEIALMKKMLATLGGMDETAYKHMHSSMTAMVQAQQRNTNPSAGFVEQMTPHHAGALEMSIPAILHSTDPKIIKLAEEIIISQTREIAAFRAWSSKNSK